MSRCPLCGMKECCGSEYKEDVEQLLDHIAELEYRIHEACEIYTGMDGFIAETCPEGYQQRILKQMYDALQEPKK